MADHADIFAVADFIDLKFGDGGGIDETDQNITVRRKVMTDQRRTENALFERAFDLISVEKNDVLVRIHQGASSFTP
jgi:hypothetical protein